MWMLANQESPSVNVRIPRLKSPGSFFPSCSNFLLAESPHVHQSGNLLLHMRDLFWPLPPVLFQTTSSNACAFLTSSASFGKESSIRGRGNKEMQPNCLHGTVNELLQVNSGATCTVVVWYCEYCAEWLSVVPSCRLEQLIDEMNKEGDYSNTKLLESLREVAENLKVSFIQSL